LSYNAKAPVFVLAPQGWGFFTRNPREEEIFVYREINGKWLKCNISYGDPSFYFGASRNARKIIVEELQLVSQIKDSTMWVNGDLTNTLSYTFNRLPVLKLSAFTTSPELSGDFILMKQKNVPWAWSKNYDDITMPYKCVHVHLTPSNHIHNDGF